MKTANKDKTGSLMKNKHSDHTTIKETTVRMPATTLKT
jgi:hypothetical protein